MPTTLDEQKERIVCGTTTSDFCTWRWEWDKSKLLGIEYPMCPACFDKTTREQRLKLYADYSRELLAPIAKKLWPKIEERLWDETNPRRSI